MVDLAVRCRNAIGLFPSGAGPGQPTNLRTTNITATFIDLAWDAAVNAGAYNVYESGILITSVFSPITTKRIDNLAENTTYHFEVRAATVPDNVEGVPSNTLNVTTLVKPEWISIPAPVFELGRAETTDLKLNIDPPPSGTFVFTASPALPASITLDQATGVLSYNGALPALNTPVTFSFADLVNQPVTSVTTVEVRDTTVPTKPSNLAATNITSTGFLLSFTHATDPSGIHHYDIWRNGVFWQTILFTQGTSIQITGQTPGANNLWGMTATDNAGNTSLRTSSLRVIQSAFTGTVWATQGSPGGLACFPGFSGFGATTTHGSGRDAISGGLGAPVTIYFITNLNLSGTGSLKQFLTATGRRIGIPCISGIIDYSNTTENSSSGRIIRIDDGNFYYAGQCAPSPGLWVLGADIIYNIDLAKDMLVMHLPAVQNQFISPTAAEASGDCMGLLAPVGGQLNTNLVIAHSLMALSTDESMDMVNGCNKILLWRNMFCLALHDNIHPNGPHGFGPLISNARNTTLASFIGNLFAHLNGRHPLTRADDIDIVNNLMYNYGGSGILLENLTTPVSRTNIRGTITLRGPNSPAQVPIRKQPNGAGTYKVGSSWHISGNKAIGYNDVPELALVNGSANGTQEANPISSAMGPGTVVTDFTNEEEAVRLVARWAGPWPASRVWIPSLIAANIEAALTNGSNQGGIINHVADIGGIPSLAVNSIDHTVGADPIPGIITQSPGPQALGTAGRTVAVSGYTALEEWTHRMHNAKVPAQ